LITQLAAPFDSKKGSFIQLYIPECIGKKIGGVKIFISKTGDFSAGKFSASSQGHRGLSVEEPIEPDPKDAVSPDGLVSICQEGNEYPEGSCETEGSPDLTGIEDVCAACAPPGTSTHDAKSCFLGSSSEPDRKLVINKDNSNFMNGRAVRIRQSELDKPNRALGSSSEKRDDPNLTIPDNIYDRREWIIFNDQSYRTMDPAVWPTKDELLDEWGAH